MEFESRYSLLDRLLHRVAFASRSAQVGLADLEGRMFRAEIEPVRSEPPVLVTALPRAGTTILLEILAATPTLATHSYRDLPFVLCPMLWQRFAKRFQKPGEPRERAHGDGLQIHLDSPEAFEEMVWMAFFGARYRGDRLAPWTRCDEPEFVAFLREHQRRVVALRRRDKPTATRYVSKNNLNVARLPAIWGPFPDARVVVPFREPLQHAASLLRQHRRFLELHQRDRFARRYMAGIGHFDFGANLKPVDFGGWLDAPGTSDPLGLGYWLTYWVAAYRHVLEQSRDERLLLVEFEALGRGERLASMAEFLDLPIEQIEGQRARLQPIAPREVEVEGCDTGLIEQARALHGALSELADGG